MTAPTHRRPVSLSTLLTGPVTVRELLDIVAAVGGEPRDVDAQVARLYDWHHARAVLAIQLSLAPLAVAALAVVAKGSSTLVVALGGAIVGVSLFVAFWRLRHINQIDREYALALRLSRALLSVQEALAACLHGEDMGGAERPCAHDVANGVRLYEEIGNITMVDYRSDAGNREVVRQSLGRSGADHVRQPHLVERAVQGA